MVAIAAHAQNYTLTTLASFTGTNGSEPYAGLTLDGSGNLYGTTRVGGASSLGTVFKIAAGTSTLTTFATFTGTANGANPEAGLALDGSGNLYGTTNGGGSSNDGTVFKIAAGTNTPTTLATFTGTANGMGPLASLTLDSSGNFYGTTYQGGASNDGTVFKIAAGTNALTTLVTFTGTANGANPEANLTLDSNGNLYGTTEYGGSSNDGTVFKIAAGTGTFTTLATFTGTANGSVVGGGVTLDGNGNLYGTTSAGGASNAGTVFKIAAGTSILTTLATFTGAANGATPDAGLTIDSNGNLYGTTYGGGASSDGTVFKIAAGTNTLTTLATFTGANGANSLASLTMDGSGNLYGTTLRGSANNNGTVFKLSPVSAAAPEPSALLFLVPSTLGVLAVRRAYRKV